LAWSKLVAKKPSQAKPLLNLCPWAVLGKVSFRVSLPADDGGFVYKVGTAPKDTQRTPGRTDKLVGEPRRTGDINR